ncbi:MAG: RDD family protein [Puniceicoccales bacterium]|nr:RDD family protein [Puniceicoccales bacterium]
MKNLDISHPLKRLLAAIADLLLLNAVSQIVNLFLQPYFPRTPFTGSLEDLNDAHFVAMSTISILYFVLMEWAPWGGTFGKLALGIRVVTDKDFDEHNDDTPRHPLLWRVVIRNIAKILVLPTFSISFLLSFVTPRRQTLHDLLSGTMVTTERHLF